MTRRYAQAIQHGIHQAFPINRQGERPSHAYIVEGGLALVEAVELDIERCDTLHLVVAGITKDSRALYWQFEDHAQITLDEGVELV